jgi:raffinose/stachyose/melibiose transport system permease protein
MELHTGKLARLFVYALLGAAAFSVAAPLALMILNSLRSNFDILISPLGWPSEPEWGVFARVWKEAQLGQAILNSLVIAAATVAIVCTISSMAAWVIARRTVPGWMTVSLYFLATTTVPIQMFMFPLYFMMAKLGLINSPVAVIIIYSAIFTPFSLFLLRTYVLDVPMELEEAARIDGASDWAVFTKVIVPLISPGLLTVALIVCLNVWNEFLIAITFLQNAEAATATARFYQLTGRYGNNLADLMAVATIIALPTLVFFVLVQRRFIEGVSAGAVKG